jgi:hypothetical protein
LRSAIRRAISLGSAQQRSGQLCSVHLKVDTQVRRGVIAQEGRNIEVVLTELVIFCSDRLLAGLDIVRGIWAIEKKPCLSIAGCF